MVFESIFGAFSSPVLYPLVVFVTLILIAVLHLFFSLRYGHDAHKDTPTTLYGSLAFLVIFSFLFGISSIFAAVSLGVFLGEMLGLFVVSVKNKTNK